MNIFRQSVGGVIKLIDLIYPIGKVESTTNAKWNPNTLFPWQTWERYAKGRTLVGVDESDSSFNTVGKTGGNKTHHHNLSSDGWADTVIDGNYTYGSFISVENNMMMLRIRGASGQENASSVSKPYATPLGGKTNAANGLQPYVTVYYWRRTA